MFLYLDAQHTIGTDVILDDSGALCMVTVSSFTNTKQLYQTVLRARSLLDKVLDEDAVKERNTTRQMVTFICSGIDASREEFVDFDALLAVCDENKKRLNERENSLIVGCRTFSVLSEWLLGGRTPADCDTQVLDDRSAYEVWEDRVDELCRHIGNYLWMLYNEAPENELAEVLRGDQGLLENFLECNPRFKAVPNEELVSRLYDAQMEVEQEMEQENETEELGSMPSYVAYEEECYGAGKKVELKICGRSIYATENFVRTASNSNSYVRALAKPAVFLNTECTVVTLNEAEAIMANLGGKVWSPYLLEFYEDISFLGEERLATILVYSGVYRRILSLSDSLRSECTRECLQKMRRAGALILREKALSRSILSKIAKWDNNASMNSLEAEVACMR